MGQFEKGNKYAFDKRTTEERREIAVKGGIASGEARSFKAFLQKIDNERVSADSPMTRKEYYARKLADLMAKGNIKAFELYLKIMGELDNNVNVTINQPRDLTLEEAAALQKHLEENY